ncbi:MAG TPA: serine--tRNA ligase [Thermoplasmata archaeon]|nr:serine--tRNA ligase [Thermoplasmata archaeon]
MSGRSAPAPPLSTTETFFILSPSRRTVLSVDLIRESTDSVREALKKRFKPELEQQFEKLLAVDSEWRKTTTTVRDLRAEKNKVSSEIARAKADEKKAIIGKASEISCQIAEGEATLARLEADRDALLSMLPNLPHPDVPVGPTEESNKTLLEWGERRDLGFPPKDHIDLGLGLGMMDLERAAKVSGARFYYLKGDLVLLELALMRYALDLLRTEGFLPVSTPALARERAFHGTGFLPTGREDLYKIENEDLYLVGTAEVALGAMHLDEMLREDDLPLRYAGFSACFRTEAGAHGRDSKGIFRVHQFYKVEMFVFSYPEKSWEEHQRMIGIGQRIYRELGIPHRVVDLASGELGASAARKYDIEAWLPGQGKYREVVSCSNCTDYQARRLGAKFVDKRDQKVKPVHTLNSTAIASTRTIVAIMENFQRPNGSIEVPKVLRTYLGKEILQALSPTSSTSIRVNPPNTS